MEKEAPIMWHGTIYTNCQICEHKLDKFFIDGKLLGRGTWAIMCVNCHREMGSGLGVGRGQKYKLDTLIKVGG